MVTFEEMNLDPAILKALNEMNIITPTPVQEQAIPVILESIDANVFAQAKTGSGKTLAFGIPIAEQLDPELKKVQAVILVPTRELCKQVHDVIMDLTKYRQLRTVEVYGGVSMENQILKIQQGAQIVIATPGRLIDIYERKDVTFEYVRFLVLDEADRMLDMGFLPDIEYLLMTAMKGISPRLMLFSATLLEEIKILAHKFTHGKPVKEVNVSQDTMTVENCSQYYYLIDDRRDKYYHFVRILRQEKPTHSLIFVNTKKTAEWLFDRLRDEKGLGLRLEVIEGDLSQHKRELVLDAFRNQKINALIATDVAARGLDIPEITHVFNYDVPQYAENYVHRIGRTSRMDREGTAITLCLQDQYNFLCRIEGFMKKDINKRSLPARTGGSGSNGSPRRDSNPHPSNAAHNNPRPQNPRYSRPTQKSSDNYTPDRRRYLY